MNKFTEVKRQYQTKIAELEKLEREQDVLNKRFELLEMGSFPTNMEETTATVPETKIPETKTTTSPSRSRGPRGQVREAVEKVLARSSGMRAKDIIEKIAAMDLPTTSVSVTLNQLKNKGIVESPERGFYRLKDTQTKTATVKKTRKKAEANAAAGL